LEEESMIEIRPIRADEADVLAYRDLRLQALRDHPEAFGSAYEENVEQPLAWFRERVHQNTKSPDQLILIAEVLGQFKGMVGLMRQTGRKVRHKAIIWGLYVDPQLRGKKLGRDLMKAAIEHANTLDGLEQIQLNVVTENQQAYQLYTRLRFEPYGLEKQALKVGERYYNEAYLVLNLPTDEENSET
jgi:ribosomal protein S18 acetylase RimI-like enzyme